MAPKIPNKAVEAPAATAEEKNQYKKVAHQAG